MRILMTTDTVGGVWTYAVELAAGLQRLGADVALAAMGGPLDDEQWKQVRRIPGMRVFESDYRLEWMADPWVDVTRAGRWLQALEKRLEPDVIHLNGYAHGSLPWRCPVIVVGHSCVVSWWHAVHGAPPPSDYARYRQVVRDGLQHADRVIAPSHAMRDALQQHYGPLPRTDVIYNGCEAGRFRPARKEALLLGVGRLWDAGKNIESAAVAAASTNWPLYVAGETRHPDHGGEAVLGKVKGLGKLSPDALGRWYARAAVYVHPARYEPFGLSVLEAAFSGCALILGDIPSLRELWDGAALFVEPDNRKALADALNRTIDDPPLRARLGHAARERADFYTLDATVSRYAELYRELADRSDATRRRFDRFKPSFT